MINDSYPDRCAFVIVVFAFVDIGTIVKYALIRWACDSWWILNLVKDNPMHKAASAANVLEECLICVSINGIN